MVFSRLTGSFSESRTYLLAVWLEHAWIVSLIVVQPGKMTDVYGFGGEAGAVPVHMGTCTSHIPAK